MQPIFIAAPLNALAWSLTVGPRLGAWLVGACEKRVLRRRGMRSL